MADILKISTPLVDKSVMHPNKPISPSDIPFDLADVSKVIKPGAQSELQGRNNGLIQKEDAPAILMNMLKDPSVAVGFLKNIFMLQEIIKLLPVNNSTVSQEIQLLFNALLVDPDSIVDELMRQEFSSTSFKGELFDFLRQLLTENPKPEMRYGIVNLLKSINAAQGKQSIMQSIANTLTFLADSLQSSQKLSAQLQQLAKGFGAPGAEYEFEQLKGRTLELLQDVQQSILYSPKLQKIVPLLIYNLSRFNDNPDFLREAFSSLMTILDGPQQKERLTQLLHNLLTREHPVQEEPSKIMDVLAKLIGRQTSESDLKLLNADKIEKIVYSLLSSPCNFTPLLHFIIPVQAMDIKAFAEIWIDPNETSDKKDKDGKAQDQTHMMIVFEVDGIGRFEAELFVKGQEISLSLLCPAAYVNEFAGFGAKITRATAATGYRFQEIKVDKLERQRSLMDVFKTLPHRRTGIDVKI